MMKILFAVHNQLSPTPLSLLRWFLSLCRRLIKFILCSVPCPRLIALFVDAAVCFIKTGANFVSNIIAARVYLSFIYILRGKSMDTGCHGCIVRYIAGWSQSRESGQWTWRSRWPEWGNEERDGWNRIDTVRFLDTMEQLDHNQWPHPTCTLCFNLCFS